MIEDLHWIDASTLEFLGQFIAEGLHDRILTVLTFRPEFRTPWPAAAHQTSIALNRLTRRQVGELMRRESGSALPDSLVAQIYQRTGGVPLLVEEFSRIIGEAELERDIPSTLQELVLARMDRMSSNREIAQMAATLGREFPYDILAAVVTNPATLLGELAKLVDAQILYVNGQPPQCTYGFKHALLEEALHGALRAEERTQFHRQVAEAMEARFPEMAERQPELLAQHFNGSRFAREGGLLLAESSGAVAREICEYRGNLPSDEGSRVAGKAATFGRARHAGAGAPGAARAGYDRGARICRSRSRTGLRSRARSLRSARRKRRSASR